MQFIYLIKGHANLKLNVNSQLFKKNISLVSKSASQFTEFHYSSLRLRHTNSKAEFLQAEIIVYNFV